MVVPDKIKCEVCGLPIFPDSPCPICGWDGSLKYDHLKNAEDFDNDLFESIKLPKKPPSPLKCFLIFSILPFTMLFLNPIFFALFIICEVILFLCIYLPLRYREKKWIKTSQNIEAYKINQYQNIKPKKDKENYILSKVQRSKSAIISYEYSPYRYSPTTRYFVYSPKENIVEIILEDKEYITIPFPEIIGCQILTNDAVQNSIGSAIIGGAIAGETGAIIGAMTATKTISSFIIRINSNNLQHPVYDIQLIKSKIGTKSKEYKIAVEFANNIQSHIKTIISNQTSYIGHNSFSTKHNSDNIDELKRYKDLLDSGIITQEEFETKKKQILGL